ncbi:MAG: hypothetical protein KAW12_15070 [Candidatus Aminicenantes bacterium]|nr:hypothetical protein [Candidatus Aminicenantes bacterium]
MSARNKIEKVKESVFEKIKKLNQYGQESWSARELSKILGYVDYRNFISVLGKAKDPIALR